MTPFIYRDPFTAHEVAPELTADEQATVERFGIHDDDVRVCRWGAHVPVVLGQPVGGACECGFFLAVDAAVDRYREAFLAELRIASRGESETWGLVNMVHQIARSVSA